MDRGTAALAYSYFLHWLKKEDLYSQQSPFVFNLYQGLVEQLASKSNSDGKQSNPYWKPTPKGITLLAYFCSKTPGLQVLEIGTGNAAVTRGLESLPLGKLHSLEEDLELWKEAQVKGNPSTNYLLGNAEERLPELLEGLVQLDFLFVNSLHSKTALLKVIELCMPKLHSESILALAHIHRSTEMEQAWSDIQADPRVRLTLDFFDYGLVWFAYPGPKTHLILSA
jgi:predicted O-methyltransferase YrrM